MLGWLWGDKSILPYVIQGPFMEIWEYDREFAGNSQGEKFGQGVGTLYNNIGPKWHCFYMGGSPI